MKSAIDQYPLIETHFVGLDESGRTIFTDPMTYLDHGDPRINYLGGAPSAEVVEFEKQ